MKALVLAAGKSTRLGTLGATQPKPMLPLRGRPVLEWTLDQLRAAGVTDVVFNLHHAPEVIPAHFGDGSALGMRLTYLYEPEILGTAGAVRNARSLLADDTFLVLYGDTVLDWEPRPMIAEHRQHRPLATIVVAEVEDASRLGVVRFDAERRIEQFYEKPGRRPDLGRWVSAGVCVLEPAVFDYLPPEGFYDLGGDLFPDLLARAQPLRVFPRPRPLLLLDTPEQYEAAQTSWEPPRKA